MRPKTEGHNYAARYLWDAIIQSVLGLGRSSRAGSLEMRDQDCIWAQTPTILSSPLVMSLCPLWSVIRWGSRREDKELVSGSLSLGLKEEGSSRTSLSSLGHLLDNPWH